MERRVEFSEPVSPFVTVSTIIHEEDNERLLVIEMDGAGKIVFRGDDIAAFHDAVHKCEKVVATLELTLRMAKTANAEQPDPEADEEESEPLSGMARGMLWQLSRGYRVQDNLEGGICRLTGALATMPEKHLEELQAHRFVQILKQDERNSRCTWGISTEGAAYLAEQEG